MLPLKSASAAALVAAFAFSATAAQASPRVTEIPLRDQNAVPGDIVAGPDGAMYTPDSSLGKVWRIGDNGKVRSFDIGGGATGIASAHGALWVSDRDNSRIVRLTLDGKQKAYPVSAARSRPTSRSARTARCGSPSCAGTRSAASASTAR